MTYIFVRNIYEMFVGFVLTFSTSQVYADNAVEKVNNDMYQNSSRRQRS